MSNFKVLDLEALFNSSVRLDNLTLTTNLDMRTLEETFNATAQKFENDGLGIWEGIALELEDGSTVVFANSERGSGYDFGCEAWIETKGAEGVEKTIALLETHLAQPEQALYMHPISGRAYPRPQ
jgi:hypothetical protein